MKNVYRIIDTREDKTVLAVHDPTRPFALIAFGGKTGRIMRVWRYAHKESAAAMMRRRMAMWADHNV